MLERRVLTFYRKNTNPLPLPELPPRPRRSESAQRVLQRPACVPRGSVRPGEQRAQRQPLAHPADAGTGSASPRAGRRGSGSAGGLRAPSRCEPRGVRRSLRGSRLAPGSRGLVQPRLRSLEIRPPPLALNLKQNRSRTENRITRNLRNHFLPSRSVTSLCLN